MQIAVKQNKYTPPGEVSLPVEGGNVMNNIIPSDIS